MLQTPNRRAGRGPTSGLLTSPSLTANYWTSASRPTSPGIPDNASEASSVMPISQQNASTAKKKEKYNHLSYWKARKVFAFV